MAIIQPNKDFQVDLNSLDDSQYKAVTSTDDNILIRASAGSGKALDNNTNVLTSKGWKKISDLTLNNLVAGSDGLFHQLIGIYPQGLKQVYKVIFSDNSVVRCSPDHLWTYQTKSQRDTHYNDFRYSKTKTTKEILESETIKNNNGSWNIYIPMIQPIHFSNNNLPIDPYLLGVLLGEGCWTGDGITFTCAEKDLLEKVENILQKYQCSLQYTGQYDYGIRGEKGFGYNNCQDYVGATITALGLRGTNSHTKFIPSMYLFTTEENRIALLQGLIDTDGCCQASEYDITLASKQLILDIKFLCESLGFTATYSEKMSTCNGKNCGIVYRLCIKTSKAYPKIHTTLNKDSRWKKGQTSARRTIREIIPTDEFVEMTCIAIDSPDHLFVIDNCIVTHNTKCLLTAVADHRYNYLNDRICAITFTRAAGEEMRVKLQRMGIYDVEVTTIHSWARKLLYELGDKYGLKIQVMEENEIKDALRQVSKQYLLKSKVRSVNIDILYQYVTGSKRMEITDNYRRTLNALEARYIKYKRDNLLYDFTDYPLYLYDILVAYDDYIRDIDALFVDEFQDVDPIQLQTFERVICKKKFFIGDQWQSIYQFRNADGEAFNKLDNFTVYKLKYNYRSYQEIIDYAVNVYELLQKRLNIDDCYIAQVLSTKRSKVICVRGEGGNVTIINPWGRITHFGAAQVDHDDPTKVLKDFLDMSPTILCRTNKQVKSITDNSYYTAETIHQAKGLEYTNVLVVDSVISSSEDLNIAYVALTRARNSVMVISWPQLEDFILKGKITTY